jgi:hypothetical protein
MLGLDDRVLKTGTVGSATDARLCVCYAIDGDTSDWSPITTEPKRERLPIKDEWRSGGNRECSGGYAQWLLDDQYLQDGANTYHGPNAAFVAASWQECTALDTRARVSGEGMALVDQEIAAQRRRR